MKLKILSLLLCITAGTSPYLLSMDDQQEPAAADAADEVANAAADARAALVAAAAAADAYVPERGAAESAGLRLDAGDSSSESSGSVGAGFDGAPDETVHLTHRRKALINLIRLINSGAPIKGGFKKRSSIIRDALRDRLIEKFADLYVDTDKRSRDIITALQRITQEGDAHQMRMAVMQTILSQLVDATESADRSSNRIRTLALYLAAHPGDFTPLLKSLLQTTEHSLLRAHMQAGAGHEGEDFFDENGGGGGGGGGGGAGTSLGPVAEEFGEEDSDGSGSDSDVA